MIPALALTLALMEPCQTVYHVRVHYEDWPGHWKYAEPTPEAWWDRAAAEALRDQIRVEGLVIPWPLLPDPDRGERRIAPSNLKWLSVKRKCCYMNVPIPERPPCEHPDGDPPPGV